MADSDIGKVGYPDQVGSRLIESLGEQILERQRSIGLLRGSGRLDSRHFGEIHSFHQPVHSTFADGYAKITCEAKLDFTASQALMGLRIDFQDFLADKLVL